MKLRLMTWNLADTAMTTFMFACSYYVGYLGIPGSIIVSFVFAISLIDFVQEKQLVGYSLLIARCLLIALLVSGIIHELLLAHGTFSFEFLTHYAIYVGAGMATYAIIVGLIYIVWASKKGKLAQ